MASIGDLHETLVDVLCRMQSKQGVPTELVLDLDATDDPLHGDQLGKFFHGYYKHYCYLPLYIFCEGWPLLALKPEVCFMVFPWVPSPEGQYLIKDFLLFGAALVIGGTVREEQRKPGVRH